MSSLSRPPLDGRIAALRSTLRERRLDCLLISSRQNVHYVVGFAGSAGWVLVSESDAVLVTDARYTTQATRDIGNASVRLADAGLTAAVASYVATHEPAVLAFEGEHLSYATVKTLESALRDTCGRCELCATESMVEDLRATKDEGELESIRHAAGLADGAIAHARAVVQCGMTERELAWHIERWLRENGSGPIPFDIIVASGPNAALPHATPSDRTFAEGEPIVIDLGATSDSYCSDLTRTLFLHHMAPPFAEAYRTVLSAHNAALAGVRAGMHAVKADELARDVIRGGGLEDAFTHGLGHGVGLEIHEKPGVGRRSPDVLLDHMVFTIEPGVYLPGQGGVRIEDTVVLLNGRAQSLSHSDKEDPIVMMQSGPHRA